MKMMRLAALILCSGLSTVPAIADLAPGYVPHEDDLVAVRFRSFGNTGGSELFLGVPDLGVGGNREEVNLRWTDGDFPFTFTLDRVNDLLKVEINGQELTYTDLSSKIAAIRPGSPYTLLDLNLLQVDVAQRDPGSAVQVLDLRLNGEPLGDLVPENDGFFTWTATDECVAVKEVAVLTGTLRLSGSFGRSQERSRVELKAGVREADGLDCVTRILTPPTPNIFRNGLEPVSEPGEEQASGAPQCTTSPWSFETGPVQALGTTTLPVGKTYEQDCALTAPGGTPGFVTTEAPRDDTLIASRFYFHADELDLAGNDAVIFMARDGVTPQVKLALREVGQEQHLVVSYRSNGALVEHGVTFPTLPVWQAATVIWNSGDGDGRLTVRLDDRTQLDLGNLSNDGEVVNELDMGLVSAPGSSGTARFDAFHARRELPEPALLTIDEISNFSTRAPVGRAARVVPGGFIIAGDTKKCVVLRGRGPSLAVGELPTVQDPNLTLVRKRDRKVLEFNDDWRDHPGADRVELFGVAPGHDRDAAIYTCLEPGGYTATLRLGKDRAPALGIVEVIDVDRGSAYLFNISTRAEARIGPNRKVGGFIIEGDAPRTVLIRGRGLSVNIDGVTLLDNPVLDLKRGPETIATNDDWQASADVQAISLTGEAPAHPTDAAILVTLEPGAYTVFLGSKNLARGIGIIEVFDVFGPVIAPN